MRRLFIFITMISMMLSMTVSAVEAETFISGDYEYTLLEDGTAEITCYYGEATELEVPGELDGYAVTGIGDRAISYCDSLSNITLPEGLISIGDRAFCDCSSLSSITLPDSIDTIGGNPFSGDILSIKVSPDNPYLAVIDGVLFSKPDKRLIYFLNTKEEYVVPDDIKVIGEWAFCGCSSLSSITLPEGLTSIGDWVFGDCSSLSSITLPEGMTSIGGMAFGRCFSLSSITLPEELTSIGDGAFRGCSSLSSITLPEGLTSIGDEAFGYCDSLSSITLPEGLTSIGDDAFYDCSNLSSIVVTRGSYAEEYCKENGLNYTYTD